METLPNNHQIIDLLGKLKKSDANYPADALANQRQRYVKQINSIGSGVGISAGIKSTLNSNGTGTGTTITSKILETTLIFAIAVEASTAAYLYRNKIAEIFKPYTNSGNVQEVVQPATADEANPVPELTETPEIPVVIINAPASEPSNISPEIAEDDSNNVYSTPSPNGNNGNHYGQTPKAEQTKDNNGNHYGQTPKPERIIENNAGGNGNGGGNDGDKNGSADNNDSNNNGGGNDKGGGNGKP